VGPRGLDAGGGARGRAASQQVNLSVQGFSVLRN
jgi:hypothetical protein